jgi:hypothetical protein
MCRQHRYPPLQRAQGAGHPQHRCAHKNPPWKARATCPGLGNVPFVPAFPDRERTGWLACVLTFSS